MKTPETGAIVAVVAAIVVFVVFAASYARMLGLLDFASATLEFGRAEERWVWTAPCGIVGVLAMKTRVKVRDARSLARAL